MSNKEAVIVQPFEQRSGYCGWDGIGADYRWGQAAERLGLHWDDYILWHNSPDDWTAQAAELEKAIKQMAQAELGDMFKAQIPSEYEY